MRRIAFLPILCLFWVCGCSYAVKIDPNIDPTASVASKLPMHVGVFVPQDVRACVASDNSDWLHSYSFNMGEAIESMVYKSVGRVFVAFEKLDAYPSSQSMSDHSLNWAIVAKLGEAKVALNMKEGFFQDTASGSTHIAMGLTFFDSALVQFTSVQASGMGVSSEGLGAVTTGKKQYSVSVESAVRNLGDELVQQMYGNYDIRKRAEAAGH